MKELIKKLIEQIEMSDFKDENGMSLKNNKSYNDIKDLLSKSKAYNNTFVLTTSMLGYKREDIVETEDTIHELVQNIAKAQEENEFITFTTVDGINLAVRAHNIEAIVQVKDE